MAGDDQPTDGARAPRQDDLTIAWDSFRAGGVATCKRDGGPMALSVDGTALSYRFVCVGCGYALPWFTASGDGKIRVRGFGLPQDRGPTAADD
jgi:hypothetical protein